MKKIVIELTKNNNVRKVYSNVPLELARDAVDNVYYYPGKIKLSKRYRFAMFSRKFFGNLKSRSGYIWAAVKLACKSDFSKQDINRHQGI